MQFIHIFITNLPLISSALEFVSTKNVTLKLFLRGRVECWYNIFVFNEIP